MSLPIRFVEQRASHVTSVRAADAKGNRFGTLAPGTLPAARAVLRSRETMTRTPSLVPCTRCRRHVRGDALRCPFCSFGASTFARALVSVAAAAATTASLGACYGAPPKAKRSHEHTFELDEPAERVFAWVEAGGVTLGCVTKAQPDGSRVAQCNELSLQLTPHDKKTVVRCTGGTIGVCRDRLDKLRAAVETTDAGAP